MKEVKRTFTKFDIKIINCLNHQVDIVIKTDPNAMQFAQGNIGVSTSGVSAGASYQTRAEVINSTIPISSKDLHKWTPPTLVYVSAFIQREDHVDVLFLNAQADRGCRYQIESEAIIGKVTSIESMEKYSPPVSRMTISVGESFHPHCIMMSNNGEMSSEWNRRLVFSAFPSPVEGTRMFTVMIRIQPRDTRKLNRVLLIDGNVPPRNELSGSDWAMKFQFYAFTQLAPGTVRYSVGEADGGNGRRSMITNENRDLNYDGWTHKFSFYAFPSVA